MATRIHQRRHTPEAKIRGSPAVAALIRGGLECDPPRGSRNSIYAKVAPRGPFLRQNGRTAWAGGRFGFVV